MAEPSIVQGLFGITPEAYQRQQQRQAMQDAIAMAQLDPMQLARANIRAKVQKLAESDLTIRSDLEKLYKELQDAVQKKAASLYPQPSAELPSGKAAIAAAETDYNQRLKAIDSQLERQTTNLTLGNKYISTSGLIEAPTELGKAIQNLLS